MGLDVRSSAQAVLRVGSQEGSDQLLRVAAGRPPETELRSDYQVAHDPPVGVEKSRAGLQHLKGKSTQTPPVHRKGIAGLQEDLRSEILWSTTESISGGGGRHVKLRQTKIGHPHVTIPIQQDVLGLQVTIQTAVLVQVLECKQNFRTVKSHLCLRKPVGATEVVKELTPVAELSDEVKLGPRLEGVAQSNQEGVAVLLQDLPLRPGVLHLVLLGYHLLVQNFHGVDLCGAPLLDHQDLSEGPLPHAA
mmetsp:Transcript_42428/g.96433  ORF Transcript_42428/g.96433 Transcript_42428/m.96433 type:complete len:248 (-) Transcript_42428:217-960(-)